MDIPAGKSAFLVCGDDDWRVEQVSRQIIDALVPEAQREFGLDIVDGRVDTKVEMVAACRAVREAMVADGLFGGGEKTVWFREPAFLSTEKIGRLEDVKAESAALADLVKSGLPDGMRLVVSTLKVNRAQGFFKAFQSKGAVFDMGSNLRPRDLEDRASQLLDEILPGAGLEMKPAVRRAFIARVGTNSRQIVSEVEKLSCWCGKRKNVTEDDILEVVAADATSEVWDLTDAFAVRDAKKAVSLMARHLSQGENAIGLVQSLLGTVNTLLLVRDAMQRHWLSSGGRGMDWDALPGELGDALSLAERGKDIRASLAGWRGGKVAGQAAMWKVGELRAARHQLLTLRAELVSRQIPEDVLVETRLIQAIGVRRK